MKTYLRYLLISFVSLFSSLAIATETTSAHNLRVTTGPDANLQTPLFFILKNAENKQFGEFTVNPKPDRAEFSFPMPKGTKTVIISSPNGETATTCALMGSPAVIALIMTLSMDQKSYIIIAEVGGGESKQNVDPCFGSIKIPFK